MFDEFVKNIEDATKRIQDFFSKMLQDILDILEAIYAWATVLLVKIKDYFQKVYTKGKKALGALVMLLLMFLPGFLLLILSSLLDSSWMFILGLIYIFGVGVVGFAYKGNIP